LALIIATGAQARGGAYHHRDPVFIPADKHNPSTGAGCSILAGASPLPSDLSSAIGRIDLISRSRRITNFGSGALVRDASDGHPEQKPHGKGGYPQHGPQSGSLMRVHCARPLV
jgi:hypothetical protein